MRVTQCRGSLYICLHDENLDQHMDELRNNDLKRTPEQLREWLSRWPFSRFVTLTLNEPGMGVSHKLSATASRMRDRLYQFDARMNHKLLGKHWQRRPANRMLHFFAPEKLNHNPHWHGLVCFYQATGDDLLRQESIFDLNAQSIWADLVPKGSADVKPVKDLPGGIDYVAKSQWLQINYEHCIFPDEFWATHL
jgi:hypothetical protein